MEQWKNLILQWIEELEKEKISFLKNYTADIEYSKYRVLDLRQKCLYDVMDRIRDKEK